MTKLLLLLLLSPLCFCATESWGYVPINPTYGSNMFYWYYTSTAANPLSVPLVIWLQGGPGASSLFGDFVEIGPLDVNLKPRNTTWLQYANLLFIDNPVGVGFSYVTDPQGFCTTDDEIASQLLIFLKAFIAKYPEASKLPLWIFSESYGGKMTSKFGYVLANAIKNGQISVNFKGVGLGDSWIDPIDCMQSYPPYLQSISLIDSVQAENLTWYANQAAVLLEKGEGDQATAMWGTQQSLAESFAGGVNWYNFDHFDDYVPDAQLGALMEGPIRKKLGIIPDNVTWGGQSDQVFSYMSGDFMKPSVTAVQGLIDMGYEVVVYSGQLDIIVDVLCTESWLSQLPWRDLPNFINSPKLVHAINGNVNGFSKSYKNLSFWTILNAGHMVPFDNGAMAALMIESVLNNS